MSKITDTADFSAGVRDLVSLVASTMGPFGTNVMLTRNDASFVFRDGAQVIRGYNPVNAVQRTAVKRVRDAAEATLNYAGDGTSTTTVLLGSLYLAIEEIIAREAKAGKTIIRKPLIDAVVGILDGMAEYLEENVIRVIEDDGSINVDLLAKVAAVAANNNMEIGKVVADLIAQLGHSGGVKIEYSKTGKIETEVSAGYAFDSGVYNPSFLPYGEKQIVLENPYVVLVNDSMHTWVDLKKILDPFGSKSFDQAEGRALVIVCMDMGGVALATCMAREHRDAKGNPTGLQVPIYLIRPPKGLHTDLFFEEMGAVSGARIMSKPGGNLMQSFNWDTDTGKVDRLIASLNTTAIAHSPHSRKGRLTVENLVDRLEKEKNDLPTEEQPNVQTRINRLKGSVGVIRIPGETQGAIIMGKEVVEDSYMACQSAMKHGILPGCGRALYDALESIDVADELAAEAVDSAIAAVVGAVVGNAGGNDEVVRQMFNAYDDISSQKTFLVDNIFSELAQEAVSDMTQIGLAKKVAHSEAMQSLITDCMVNALEAGVLDSAGGVIAAVKNTRSEIALWGMTKLIIKDA